MGRSASASRLTRVTLICVVVVALPPAARGQRPDSTRKDTLTADSVHYGPIHPVMGYLAIPLGAATIVAAMFAPAPLAFFVGDGSDKRMAFLRDHSAAYVSAGGSFHGGETWAHSVNLEALHHGVHYELIAEDFWRPRHVRYLTGRAGYLWHPRGLTAGGLTLGYMHSDEDRRESGAEIGLPFFLGDSLGSTARFEPVYVLSGRGLQWSYRLLLQYVLPNQRYLLGASLVGKVDPPLSPETQSDFTHTAYLITFGTRF